MHLPTQKLKTIFHWGLYKKMRVIMQSCGLAFHRTLPMLGVVSSEGFSKGYNVIA